MSRSESKNHDDQHELELLVAAQLEAMIRNTKSDAADSLSRKNLGKLLGWDEYKFSRLVSELRSRGWIRTDLSREALAHSLFPEASKKVEGLLQRRNPSQKEKALHKKLSKLAASALQVDGAVSVHVVDDGLASTGTPDERLDPFAEKVGPSVYSQVTRSKGGVCVGWGKTLARLVAFLGSLSRRGPTHRNISVGPTCGIEPDTTVHAFQSASSAMLADNLDKALNGADTSGVKLLTAPCLLSPSNVAGWEALKRDDVYQEYLGEHGLLAKRADTILTSVGAPGNTAFTSIILPGQTGVSAKWLKDAIWGDIGGVLLPKPEYERHTDFELLAAWWTGIKRDHIERIARDAAALGVDRSVEEQYKPAGVVVVALGDNKARCVYEAVQAGLVNCLFCEAELATKLLALP